MKKYIKPEINVVEVEMGNPLMDLSGNGSSAGLQQGGSGTSNASGGRSKNHDMSLWDTTWEDPEEENQ